MIPPFDIFRVEGDGSVLWRAAAATLEEAKTRAQELAAGSPGEYFIQSQKTGNKFYIKPDAVNATPGSGNLRFPKWEKPYRDALKEGDPQKLLEKVMATETAILERLKELRDSPDANSERMAIQDTLNGLLAIKSEKLNYPGWKPDDPRP